MSKEWYDQIALKNQGYKSNAIYKVEGISGEDVFEVKLIELLKNSQNVLDAGCGDGEFTLRMGAYTKHITGFDNSKELLKLAQEKREFLKLENVHFVYSSTKESDAMPFDQESFDLIYSRRGPTSIIDHHHLLKKGGSMIGIHSSSKEKVLDKLNRSGLKLVDIKEYEDAVAIFPNERELLKYFSAFPGNPDYTLQENESEARKIVEAHFKDGRYTHNQWRYIWCALK